MPLKIGKAWHTVCHASIRHPDEIDVNETSSRRYSVKGLSKTFDNSVDAMVTYI